MNIIQVTKTKCFPAFKLHAQFHLGFLLFLIHISNDRYYQYRYQLKKIETLDETVHVT